MSGVFPDKLKLAKVIPLYKKGDSTITDNYLPISLLPTMSKVLEKNVFNQLFAYFSDKELFIQANMVLGEVTLHSQILFN